MSEQNNTYLVPEQPVDVPHGRDGLDSYEEGVARADVDAAFGEIASTLIAETLNSVEAARWAAQYTNATVDLREDYQQSHWTLAA